jgi:putative membrane protein
MIRMKLINRIGALLLMATLAFACGSKNTETDSNKVAEEANQDKFQSREGEKDAEFVAKTVACNFGDIQLSQLAEQKSNNEQVKEVAKGIEANHSKLLKDLQHLAGQKAISVPTEPEDSKKKKIESLTKESNIKDFNKEWCKEMVSSHESTIKEFEDRWEKTEDPDLKNWIAETLPHLRSHLDKIKSCDESVAKESK